MDLTADDLAGVVDLFGGLTRSELSRACSELAFKRGGEVDSVEDAIDDAVESYRLLSIPASERNGDDPLLVVGPTAFPALPEDAEDLPHIMDVDQRDVDADVVATVAEERFAADAEAALGEGNRDRIEQLLDVSYELDVWGPVDVDATRARLVDAVE
ncbi:MAG: hypothetical protein ABEI96_06080 [Haloarculaceae archaeon]